MRISNLAVVNSCYNLRLTMLTIMGGSMAECTNLADTIMILLQIFTVSVNHLRCIDGDGLRINGVPASWVGLVHMGYVTTTTSFPSARFKLDRFFRSLPLIHTICGFVFGSFLPLQQMFLIIFWIRNYLRGMVENKCRI